MERRGRHPAAASDPLNSLAWLEASPAVLQTTAPRPGRERPQWGQAAEEGKPQLPFPSTRLETAPAAPRGPLPGDPAQRGALSTVAT